VPLFFFPAGSLAWAGDRAGLARSSPTHVGCAQFKKIKKIKIKSRKIKIKNTYVWIKIM